MDLRPEDIEMQLIDHIGIFDGIFSRDLCEEYINFFENVYSDPNIFFDGEKHLRVTEEGEKQFALKSAARKDSQLYLNLMDSNLKTICNEYINACFTKYMNEYTLLLEQELLSYYIKIQKTPPGGGFHLWHYENPGSYCHRVAVWMVYLNDIPDGEGETEFLYQKLRVKPKAGTVLIWPGNYTHVHRGNTVFTQDKYILTGWFSYKQMM